MIATALRLLLCAGLGLGAMHSQAALGEGENSIGLERMQMRARHQVSSAAQYSLHALTDSQGGVVRQYVNRQGRVFAVQWISPIYPDLGTLLGADHAAYRRAGALQAQSGPGLQRQLRHSGPDLVIQSQTHLNIFRGYAYKPSLLPVGLDVQQLGLQ
jgi:hypothetical protein